MKYSDINAKFSQKVQEYMNKGYIINSSSMSGTQGEIAKVDLVKDNQLISIWLENSFSGRYSKNAFYGDSIKLRVSEWKYPAEESIRYNRTVWHNDNELTDIETYEYYQISDYRDRDKRWYVDSIEEALRIQELNFQRSTNSYSLCNHYELKMDDKLKEIGAKYLKRAAGYQRVRMNDIMMKKSKNGYTLSYAGKTYNIK